MIIRNILALALEDMIDRGIIQDRQYIEVASRQFKQKSTNFYKTKKDMELSNPFLTISQDEEGRPLIINFNYNLKFYKSYDV